MTIRHDYTAEPESVGAILARLAEPQTQRSRPTVKVGRSVRSWWTTVMALPAPILLGAVVLVLVNMTMVRQVIEGGSVHTDWRNYVEAGVRAVSGGPIYVLAGWFSFPYSPLLAYAFGVIAPAIGYLGWTALHFAAAAAMPRPLGLIALVSFPFWWDVMAGNLVIFEVLVAAWALRGNSWAIGGMLVLALLIPRPLTIPLMAYLLWKHPEWRIRFAVIVTVLGVAHLATGHTAAWVTFMLNNASDIRHDFNLSPSRFVGLTWLPVGIALSVLLLRRGYVGLACLASSPYILPYYLLFAILDLSTGRRELENVLVPVKVERGGRGAG